MVARFDIARDLTLDELQIELTYPSDAAAERFFRARPRLMSHRAGRRSPTMVKGEHRPEETTMSIVEIYRVKVDPAQVGRLLEIHDQAVAEYQQQVPELEGIELVHLDDETWLDIICWSAPADPQRLEAAACSPAAAEVHEIMAQELAHDRGELVHGSGKAWAAAS
jgi:hypothetical protein